MKFYRSFDDRSHSEISYIMTAVKLYGITIYIHENNCENIYEVDDESPVIHLVKTHLEDGSSIYLPTGKQRHMRKVRIVIRQSVFKY